MPGILFIMLVETAGRHGWLLLHKEEASHDITSHESWLFQLFLGKRDDACIIMNNNRKLPLRRIKELRVICPSAYRGPIWLKRAEENQGIRQVRRVLTQETPRDGQP